MMVRDFHRVIGEETRGQARKLTGKLPDLLVACVGGGSNAIGLFWPFIRDSRVRIVGVEPAGHGLSTGRHGASLGAGAVGVLHGSMSYLLQNDDGQISEAHSISAGLDYPGVGPEHAYYKEQGRFEYEAATDAEALEAFQALTRLEGIMPALESAHAVAYVMRAAKRMKKSESIVIGLSGRGDKDVHTVAQALAGAKGHGATAVPLVFLTYYNPVLAFGVKAFCVTAVECGVDGVIVADLPPEEARPLRSEAEAAGLDLIHLVAPTSPPDRMRAIARAASGFLYMVSLTGVTGARAELPPDLLQHLR